MKLQPVQLTTQAPKDSRSFEEFMAAENLNSISGSDIYLVLRQAAAETSSKQAFVDEVDRLLQQRFGQTVYYFVLDFNGDMWIPSGLPNSVYWGGSAGVLPGPIGQGYSVEVFVWWV